MESFRIPDLPPSIYYIPNVITIPEERHILDSIPPTRWITLSHRRLQSLPARLTATNTLITSRTLPFWLTDPIISRINQQTKAFDGAPHGINHCLINEYLPGQGIMPHEDGAAYFPVVATVSLGGSVVLDVTEKVGKSSEGDEDDVEVTEKGPRTWRILQEPRSLLLTTDQAYTDTLHGIAGATEDVDLNERTVANWDLLGDKEKIVAQEGRNERTTRISLTYRDVKKVSSIGSKLFGKPKT